MSEEHQEVCKSGIKSLLKHFSADPDTKKIISTKLSKSQEWEINYVCGDVEVAYNI